MDRRCDLHKDCVDGSDERDCGKIYVHINSGDRTNKGNVLDVPLLSSSGLHHVPVDSVECVQCVLWSGLLVSTEGHIERSSAWRSLRWGPVRQPSLLHSSMSRSLSHFVFLQSLMHLPQVYCNSVTVHVIVI